MNDLTEKCRMPYYLHLLCILKPGQMLLLLILETDFMHFFCWRQLRINHAVPGRATPSHLKKNPVPLFAGGSGIRGDGFGGAETAMVGSTQPVTILPKPTFPLLTAHVVFSPSSTFPASPCLLRTLLITTLLVPFHFLLGNGASRTRLFLVSGVGKSGDEIKILF